MKDIISASFLAGSTQTIFGHPFDTIKTFKQLHPLLSTKNIYQQYIKPHGIKYLYRGSFSPLIGGCLQNCFIFSTEHITNKFINKISCINNPTVNSFFSGFIAGGLTSLIISPSELIKCQQQINPKNKILSIIHQNNIFRGFPITFVRDSIGFGIYFSCYQYLQKNWRDNPLINGGISGMTSWIYSYPIDVIKTKIQTEKNISVRNIIKNISINQLKSGIGIMLTRAFIVNSAIFYTFEMFITPNKLNM